jgi:hypothetical protein
MGCVAAVLARPQPDRDAVQQIESIFAKDDRANCSWSVGVGRLVHANLSRAECRS